MRRSAHESFSDPGKFTGVFAPSIPLAMLAYAWVWLRAATWIPCGQEFDFRYVRRSAGRQIGSEGRYNPSKE